MEQILQKVLGAHMLSLLDGFFGYNQVLVSPADQLKTIFRTPWGTYAYRKMPFGLINAGATFQKEMDATFKGLINHSIIVYLDDVTMFSKIDLITFHTYVECSNITGISVFPLILKRKYLQ